MNCKNCGAKILENSTYCQNCGCKIEDFKENLISSDDVKSQPLNRNYRLGDFYNYNDNYNIF
ncbi:zinc-ribbon domain-containing protein [Clostridium sp. DL1XJH146]